MGSQNCRQHQYTLDLADKSRRPSAPRAHNLAEVSSPQIGIFSPKQALGEDLALVSQMGSGAIPGMPGGAMQDFAVSLHNFPPTDEQMRKVRPQT